MSGWLVVRFERVDVTMVGSENLDYVAGEPCEIRFANGDSRDEAIERVASGSGFYDAVPLPELTPREYRLTPKGGT